MMLTSSILLSLILRAVCRAHFRDRAQILAGSSSKLCHNRGILLSQVSPCLCRFSEFQEMFGCHQDHPSAQLGNAREGAATPDSWNRFLKKILFFPQTGVDPGKVYLARRKFVKRQAKGTAQPAAKLPKFLLKESKVTQLLSSQNHPCVPKSPSNSSSRYGIFCTVFLASHPSPFLPSYLSIPPQTLRCRAAGEEAGMGTR